ncbi:MAG: phosphonate ABC transporter ATP-binding protein [Haloarcula sp.]
MDETRPGCHNLLLDGVTKQFDGKRALSDVTLRITSGERVAIVGPSGAGKTTLLRLVSGAIQPDSGTITLDGNRLRNEDVTLAYQGNTLVDRRSALANILTGGVGSLSWLRGFLEPLAPRNPEPALELLDAVGLAEKAESRVDTLSAGERQRVAFARALMQDAHVVLADEPTANLDPSSRSNVIDILNRTISDRILVTVLHETDLARERFDRLVGIADGRIHFDEPGSAVTDDQLKELFAAGASTPEPATDRNQRELEDSCTHVRWYA